MVGGDGHPRVGQGVGGWGGTGHPLRVQAPQGVPGETPAQGPPLPRTPVGPVSSAWSTRGTTAASPPSSCTRWGSRCLGLVPPPPSPGGHPWVQGGGPGGARRGGCCMQGGVGAPTGAVGRSGCLVGAGSPGMKRVGAWGGGKTVLPWGAVGQRGCCRGGTASDRVPQGDSAEEVTRRVCARSPLEPALRRALCQRVQDELSKRRGTG